ncbi:unnamed protein product [Soboliphyme baturini]|uniref:Uncharacterized protein n=1 Tax=Soboliphyme baturini TaxID=241478 RepID=A0A183J1T9_9BILA|nr:unnamed protein product [Soboliphyme baturini]
MSTKTDILGCSKSMNQTRRQLTGRVINPRVKPSSGCQSIVAVALVTDARREERAQFLTTLCEEALLTRIFCKDAV